jgi:hypothetical protein
MVFELSEEGGVRRLKLFNDPLLYSLNCGTNMFGCALLDRD